MGLLGWLKPKPPVAQAPKVEFVTAAFVRLPKLIVRQHEDSEIHKFVPPPGRASYNAQTGIIDILQIRGDWDAERFRDLGEEVWHAMGGHHD